MSTSNLPSPSQLREIVERAAEPVSSQEALLRASSRAPGPRRSRWLVIGGVLAAALIAVLAVAARGPRPADVATGGEVVSPSASSSVPSDVPTPTEESGAGVPVSFPEGLEAGVPVSVWFWVPADGTGAGGSWRLLFQHLTTYRLDRAGSDAGVGDGILIADLPASAGRVLADGRIVAVTNDTCDRPDPSCVTAPSFSPARPS